MIYNEFGNTGVKVSAIGFGAMRLPMMDLDGKRVVNDELAIPLMQQSFEMGINFVDSAPYYLESQSEIAVGKALKGYRDKVYVSTKNPIEDDNGDNWMARLEKSLKQLDTDYIDFYHFWGIGLEGFKSWQGLKYGPLEAAHKAKDQGLIKHISFSYHDDPKNFKTIVDSGHFESVLIQYNILDRNNEENIAYAKSKGLGVIVMGPVGGGRLGEPSEKIQSMLKTRRVSTAEMALRFVLANENVDMALSGMSNLNMVKQNIETASRGEHLTNEEIEHINKMVDENYELAEKFCTSCEYCKPCPHGIEIPHIFELMNLYRVFELPEHAKRSYYELINGWSWLKSPPATKCTACGECEKKCPQKLPIIKQLAEAHETLKPAE
jgi:predicted aldo/keto reductase-like oxidoreductase